jgi:hypothetical protein
MEQNTNTTTAPPVPLALLALELETTVADLAHRLGADVFMVGGFRSVTAFKAREVAEAHHRRKADAAATAARNAEQTRKFVAAQHAATPKTFTKFELGRTTIDVDPDTLPVVKMTAQAAADYDGSVMTKRPGAVDWIGGAAEGGSEFGPSKAEMQKQAAAKKAERAAQKRGGK